MLINIYLTQPDIALEVIKVTGKRVHSETRAKVCRYLGTLLST